MYQAATAIWNEIAASQPLSPPWASLFRLNQSELTSALEKMELELESQGADARTTRAYLTVAPLLGENEAISSFLEETHRLDLRAALPEVVSVNEAVLLASREFPLNPSQQEQLTQLLQAMLSAQDSQPSEQPT